MASLPQDNGNEDNGTNGNGLLLSLETVKEALPPINMYIEQEDNTVIEDPVQEKPLSQLFPQALFISREKNHEREQMDAARRAESLGDVGSVQAVLKMQAENRRAQRVAAFHNNSSQIMALMTTACIELERCLGAIDQQKKQTATLVHVEGVSGGSSSIGAGSVGITDGNLDGQQQQQQQGQSSVVQQSQQQSHQQQTGRFDDALPSGTRMAVFLKKKAFRSAAESLARAAKRAEALSVARQNYLEQVSCVESEWSVSPNSAPPLMHFVCSPHALSREILQDTLPNAEGQTTTTRLPRARLNVQCVPTGVKTEGEDYEVKKIPVEDVIAKKMIPAYVAKGAEACSEIAREAHESALAREVYSILKDGAASLRPAGGIRTKELLIPSPVPSFDPPHTIHARIYNENTIRLSSVFPQYTAPSRDNPDGDSSSCPPTIPYVIVSLQDEADGDDLNNDRELAIDADGLMLQAVAEQEVLRRWDNLGKINGHDGIRHNEAINFSNKRGLSHAKHVLNRRQHFAVLEHMMQAHSHVQCVRQITQVLDHVAAKSYGTIRFHIGQTSTTSHTFTISTSKAEFTTPFSVWNCRECIRGVITGEEPVVTFQASTVSVAPHLLEAFITSKLLLTSLTV